MYQNSYELVAFYAKQPTPKAMKSSTKETGHRLVTCSNVIDMARPHGDERLHNAAKPPDLFQQLIENSTDKEARVVDFFSGSGTTLIAAERCGRRAICFDEDPRYVDVIVERWQRLTGKKAKRTKQAA